MKINMLPQPNMEIVDDIRVMTAEEIEAEKPIFEAAGDVLPNPATSAFIGVFRGGKRVAFLVLQLQLHAEPLYVEEGHSAVLPSLVKFAEQYVLSKCGSALVYLFTPAGKVTQLATHMGFKLEPWNVMSRWIVPDPQPQAVTDLSTLAMPDDLVQ